MSGASFRDRAIAHLYRLMQATGIAPRLAITWPLHLNGARVRVPLVLGAGLDNLVTSEPWMSHLLDALLPPRGAFLDVGANVGQTLLKVKSLRPEFAWLGVEPNPVCVHYLERLIAANRFHGCSVAPIGLHRDAGLAELELYAASSVDSSASLVKSFRPGEAVLARRWIATLPAAALHRLLPEKVDCVKIDVEGGELEVVETLAPLISRWRSPVVIEILPAYSDANAARLERQRAVEREFARLGYRFLRIAKDARGRLAGLTPIESIGVHSDLALCDYLVLPAERMGDAAAIVSAAQRIMNA